MSAPKANIPKFGSFKPKPAALSSAPEKQEAESRTDVKHRRSRGSDEKEENRRHHSRHGSRSKGRLSVQHEAQPTQTSSGTSSPEIFIIDRKGDVKNLVYGSVHRYSVPPFYRYGAGYVLGASLDVKIDRIHGEDKGVVLSNWRNPRSREKYIFSRVEKERPRLLKIRPEVLAESSASTDSDFVPLQVPRRRKRKRIAGGESSDDEEKRDYRDIYGKPKDNSQPQDEDLQYATESDSFGSDTGRDIILDISMRRRNVELSRKVDQYPQDTAAWIELIDHQDVLMKTGDGRPGITNAEIKSTAEIKIHMYEKALGKIQSLKDKEMLLLGLMAEGTKIWELKAQSDRWEQISKDYIGSLLLWTSYLNFKQSTFTTYRYDDIREVYLKRIQLLLGTTPGSTKNTPDDLFHELLYVILRLTLFIREAGYTELAVAIWQGLLELNFKAPKDPLAKDVLMDSLRDFWESEVSRIGEAGSLGWNNFVTNSTNVEIPDAMTDEVDDSLDNADIFRTWSAAERIRMKCSQTPARTMDEVVEDDPYRVIMFSDIGDFLFQLPPNSKNLRSLLVDAFLLFCRLPPMSTRDSRASRKWANDPFVRDELLECTPAWIKCEYFSGRHNDEPDTGIPSFLHNPFPNCEGTPELLFGKTLAGNDYFGSPPSQQSPFEDRYAGDNGPVSIIWVRNILNQLVQCDFTEDLAEYCLAFEYHHSPATIKKIAKALLKLHPSSLRLYNAYAMIEWSRGNEDIANGVFTAALNMSASFSFSAITSDEEQTSDAIVLWRNWAWLSLEATDNTSALQQLLSIPDGRPDHSIKLSPTILLRAKQHLASTRDFLCSAGDFGRAVLYTECLALLTYLTAPPTNEPQSPAQGSIFPALETYQTFHTTLLSRLQTNSQAHIKANIHTHISTIHQSLTRLLTHHTTHGPFRPSLILNILHPLLHLTPNTDFPSPSASNSNSNTLLLNLYARTSSPNNRLTQRIRTLLHTHTLASHNDTLSSRLFHIRHELETGTVHSVRAAFEHAVSSSSSSSAGLWKLYILFCIHGDHRTAGNSGSSGNRDGKGEMRARAKDVWFRALRACPWAKELYVFGTQELGGGEVDGGGGFGISYEELRGTWRVMGEKECRVHVDLEDAFEDIGQVERDSGGRRRVTYK